MKYSNDIVLLIIGTLLVCAGLVLTSCATTPRDPSPTIETVRAPVPVNPRCAEMAQEVADMRSWCNATMIPPSRQRESCRMVASYDAECP